MSRPRNDFDWSLVESLTMLEASEAFVAERLILKDGGEVDSKSIQAKIKLIQRRVKERFECSFVQFREQKIEQRKIQLRTWQWKAAEGGNPTMLIWLGKQYLDQRDKNSFEHSGPDGRPIEMSASSLTDEQLDARIKALTADDAVKVE
jgi:hypothetical protein